MGIPRKTYSDRLERVGRVGTTTPDDEYIEVPVIIRDYSHLESLRLYPLGDVHKGSPAYAAQRWREWLDYLVERPNASLIGTGDFLNSALKTSVSDVYEETMTVGRAKRELREELRPLAARTDILIAGNHEARIHKAVGDCPIEDVAEALGVPYARASALIVYRVGDVEYDVYLRHGTGNGQSLAALAKSGYLIDADLYITGHTHRQGILRDDYFKREGTRVVRKDRRYVSSGSFLRYEGYAAERGYVPSGIGAPRVTLDGRGHDIKVSL